MPVTHIDQSVVDALKRQRDAARKWARTWKAAAKRNAAALSAMGINAIDFDRATDSLMFERERVNYLAEQRNAAQALVETHEATIAERDTRIEALETELAYMICHMPVQNCLIKTEDEKRVMQESIHTSMVLLGVIADEQEPFEQTPARDSGDAPDSGNNSIHQEVRRRIEIALDILIGRCAGMNTVIKTEISANAFGGYVLLIHCTDLSQVTDYRPDRDVNGFAVRAVVQSD